MSTIPPGIVYCRLWAGTGYEQNATGEKETVDYATLTVEQRRCNGDYDTVMVDLARHYEAAQHNPLLWRFNRVVWDRTLNTWTVDDEPIGLNMLLAKLSDWVWETARQPVPLASFRELRDRLRTRYGLPVELRQQTPSCPQVRLVICLPMARETTYVGGPVPVDIPLEPCYSRPGLSCALGFNVDLRVEENVALLAAHPAWQAYEQQVVRAALEAATRYFKLEETSDRVVAAHRLLQHLHYAPRGDGAVLAAADFAERL